MAVLLMVKIRVRPETGNLLFDFTYQGVRCREQTALKDTPANRKQLGELASKIDAAMLLGQFNYADFFPNSSKVERFEKGAEVSGSAAPYFKAFSKTWFEELAPGWRKTYRHKVERILFGRLVPKFGDSVLDAITKADLLAYRKEVAGIRGRSGELLGPESVNRHMKILRMILDEAADRFEFVTPYRGIKPLKVPKSHIEPFSLAEIQLILDNVRADFKSYFTVRFFTGMRTAEIDGLQWHYVDFDKREILIRETLVEGELSYTKTDSSQREIHMSQPVYDALKEQYEATGDRKFVFTNRVGKPLQHNNVTKRVWYPLLRYLELPRRNPYQTRHTAATLWLASGETPEWIARQMGHSNTEMLFRVYSRYVPNLTRNDGSAFESLLTRELGGAK
jgi:integrase